MGAFTYPGCYDCINREFDPAECETCSDGSKWEGENTEEELTYAEFRDFFQENI
jgi:hypothetical protein